MKKQLLLFASFFMVSMLQAITIPWEINSDDFPNVAFDSITAIGVIRADEFESLGIDAALKVIDVSISSGELSSSGSYTQVNALEGLRRDSDKTGGFITSYVVVFNAWGQYMLSNSTVSIFGGDPIDPQYYDETSEEVGGRYSNGLGLVGEPFSILRPDFSDSPGWQGPIPEPTSLALLAIGVSGALLRRKRI